jgi:hypothetical protein
LGFDPRRRMLVSKFGHLGGKQKNARGVPCGRIFAARHLTPCSLPALGLLHCESHVATAHAVHQAFISLSCAGANTRRPLSRSLSNDRPSTPAPATAVERNSHLKPTGSRHIQSNIPRDDGCGCAAVGPRCKLRRSVPLRLRGAERQRDQESGERDATNASLR